MTTYNEEVKKELQLLFPDFTIAYDEEDDLYFCYYEPENWDYYIRIEIAPPDEKSNTWGYIYSIRHTKRGRHNSLTKAQANVIENLKASIKNTNAIIEKLKKGSKT